MGLLIDLYLCIVGGLTDLLLYLDNRDEELNLLVDNDEIGIFQLDPSIE
ncbi:hypothetical protein [Halobacteriovorax marinus]|nr:hypothetical protein [Halobacteriovorax marinus]